MKLLENNPYNNWQETRKIGRWKFAFTYGLVFGLFIFLFNLLYFIFSSSDQVTFLFIIEFLAISVLVGIFGYYTLMWWIQEKIYQKRQK